MVNNDSITQINQIFTIHNNFLRVSKNPETKKLGKLKTEMYIRTIELIHFLIILSSLKDPGT